MSKPLWSDFWPEWEVEGEDIGSGAFGVVYKAVRKEYGVVSYSAIKVISIPKNKSEKDILKFEGMNDEEIETYFENNKNNYVKEIQFMESFKGKKNIVYIEDYHIAKKPELGWDIFIRMELLENLYKYESNKKISEEEVIELGKDICTALEACVNQGVIHRDIKPENILVNSDGDFKLGDFGIAKSIDDLRSNLSVRGTEDYMAPEVANRQNCDARSDIYSLGLVLYRRMNRNRMPFLDVKKQMIGLDERLAAQKRRASGEKFEAPCEASMALSEIILRACEPNPDDRFQSATEMKKALIDLSNGSNNEKAKEKNDLNRNEIEKEKNNLNSNETEKEIIELNNDPIDSSEKEIIELNNDPIDSSEREKIEKNTFENNDNKILDNSSHNSKTEKNIIDDISSKLRHARIKREIRAYKKKRRIGSFGKRRKSKAPVVAGIIVVIILVGGGYIILPKILEKKDVTGNIEKEITTTNQADTITTLSQEIIGNGVNATQKDGGLTTVSSESDEEITNKIIEEAEILASSKDYEGALSKIKAALVTYPESTDLQAKETEYSKTIEMQERAEVLEAAEEKALEGDYVSAISIINEVKESEGENKEFTNAYITYCEKYKTEVIKTADELAENGDYPVAIQKVVEATAVIEDDAELTEKITSYEDAYVSSVIKKVDKLIKDGKYEEATKLIENTQNEISEKDVFQSKIAEIEEKEAVYLLDVIKPHYTNDYKEFDNGKAKMGGIERCKGFSIKVYGWDAQSCAFFNLEGKYKKLSGMIGHLDGEVESSKKKTWKAWIYGDDDLLFECEVKPGALPVEFKIDVSDKKNIEFRTGEGNNWDTDEIGFAELKLYK